MEDRSMYFAPTAHLQNGSRLEQVAETAVDAFCDRVAEVEAFLPLEVFVRTLTFVVDFLEEDFFLDLTLSLGIDNVFD